MFEDKDITSPENSKYTSVAKSNPREIPNAKLPADADDTLDPATVIRARVFAGYAGWGAGQLESELDEEAWVVIPAHIDDCFTERPEELWKQALRRHGGHLAMFSLQPEDPSLN
jgi:putative transcriptional regulator